LNYFHPEDGSSKVFQNFRNYLQIMTVSYPGKCTSSRTTHTRMCW